MRRNAGLVSLITPLVSPPAVGQRKQATAINVSGDAIRVVGRLDEEAWLRAIPLADFVQKEPIEGAAPTDINWTRNGREIVDWSEPGVMSMALDVTASGIRPAAPQPLITAAVPNLIDARPHDDVTRDGERFLLRQPVGSSGSKVTVIVNWPEKLKQ